MKIMDLSEAAYVGNLGFEEMMKFYDKATQREIRVLEKLIDEERIKEAWALVQKVTGIKLHTKSLYR